MFYISDVVPDVTVVPTPINQAGFNSVGRLEIAGVATNVVVSDDAKYMVAFDPIHGTTYRFDSDPIEGDSYITYTSIDTHLRFSVKDAALFVQDVKPRIRVFNGMLHYDRQVRNTKIIETPVRVGVEIQVVVEVDYDHIEPADGLADCTGVQDAVVIALETDSFGVNTFHAQIINGGAKGMVFVFEYDEGSKKILPGDTRKYHQLVATANNVIWK